MLKKVDDEFAKPEEGEALVEHCVTSVTTDRSMAGDRGGHRCLAFQPQGNREDRPRQAQGRARSACFPATAAGDPGRRRSDRQRLAARV